MFLLIIITSKINSIIFVYFQQNADFREDPHGQDHHPRGGALRHDRKRQGQDPRQGGHSPRPATSDLRREAAGGWTHPVRLQHPEGVDAPPGAAPPGRHHRAVSAHPGPEVQLRQNDLPQVLRETPSPRYQLSQEQVRPHQQLAPQEEVEVDCNYFFW